MAKSGCHVTPLSWDTSPVDSTASGPRKRAVERCEKSSSRRIIDQPASSKSRSKTRVIPATSERRGGGARPAGFVEVEVEDSGDPADVEVVVPVIRQHRNGVREVGVVVRPPLE